MAAHEGYPRRYLLAIVVALFSLVVAGAPGAGAQEGTPTAGLDIPAAAECTVEPRSEDELRALFRQAAATPIPDSLDTMARAPAGAPADEQTVADINATWRQSIACMTAGDLARMFALYSDDMVRRQFLVDIAFGLDEDTLFEYTPVPSPPEQSVPFVPFDDVRVLEDGRVAVVEPGEGGPGGVLIFVKEGDRWLWDNWFELAQSGTPDAGT